MIGKFTNLDWYVNSLIYGRNGWGATAVDGLSTAIIMEDAEIVDKILRQIMLTDFTVTIVPDQPISLFETTIRYLGGLLSGERPESSQLGYPTDLASSL